MKLTYHPNVRRDLDEATQYYSQAGEKLANDFWSEITVALEEIRRFPTRHHFDASGLRRKNLKRFPYHILFEILADRIRVIVVRHDRRNPKFGVGRQ